MSERHPQGRPDDDWDADAKNDVFQKRTQKTQSMYFLNLVKVMLWLALKDSSLKGPVPTMALDKLFL